MTTDAECVIELRPGIRLICPAFPNDCDYVRVEVDGEEVTYWDHQEWRDDPQGVMGALMGELCSLCQPIGEIE